MYTFTYVPPGGTAGERLPAPRQALSPYQNFEMLACCAEQSQFAPPCFCAYPGRLSPNRVEGRFFTRIMGDLDFLLYNPLRYMLSARKTVV